MILLILLPFSLACLWSESIQNRHYRAISSSKTHFQHVIRKLESRKGGMLERERNQTLRNGLTLFLEDHSKIIFLFFKASEFVSVLLVHVNCGCSSSNPFLTFDICQKHLFLHQLIHNMTTDCLLKYKFNT